MPLVAFLLAFNLMVLIAIAKRSRETRAGVLRLQALVAALRADQRMKVSWGTDPEPIMQTEHEGSAA